MIIARVVGNAVCTVKHRKYQGQKLLQVQCLSLERGPMGLPFTAIDLVDSGEGDEVLVCREGKSAMDAVGLGYNPVNAVILGVVDGVSLPSSRENPWTQE